TAAGRTGRGQVVQYMPCAVNADREGALRAAKRAGGEMLPGFWALAQKVSSAKQALLAGTGVSEDELGTAASRLRLGVDGAGVLDERLTAAFSLSGAAEACLAGAAKYAAAGVTELALTFSGPAALDEMHAL